MLKFWFFPQDQTLIAQDFFFLQLFIRNMQFSTSTFGLLQCHDIYATLIAQDLRPPMTRLYIVFSETSAFHQIYVSAIIKKREVTNYFPSDKNLNAPKLSARQI